MVLWIMPRKPSPQCSGWTRVRLSVALTVSRLLSSEADPADFDKANEILFRLGIIYKQQGKYQESLECFDRILRNPPNPLAHADIWFQIGHVYEQQHDVSSCFVSLTRIVVAYLAFQHVRAREAYERVVQDNPGHAKVLQQLGWLYHQDGSSFQNQELAIQYLTKSLEAGKFLWSLSHAPFTCLTSLASRSCRCAELVPSRPRIHGRSEVQQSLRGVSAGGVP